MGTSPGDSSGQRISAVEVFRRSCYLLYLCFHVLVVMAHPLVLCLHEEGSIAPYAEEATLQRVVPYQALLLVLLIGAMHLVKRLVPAFNRPLQAFFILQALTAGLYWQAHHRGMEPGFLFPGWQVGLWGLSALLGIVVAVWTRDQVSAEEQA